MWALLSMAWSSTCDSIYTRSDLQTSLDEVDRLQGNGDIDRAIDVLRKTENLLPCLEGLVDRQQLGRFARSFSIISFFQQDAEAAVRWGRVMKLATPELSWGDLPDEHPLIGWVEEAGMPEPSVPEEMGWVVPKKGAVFVNGRFSASPSGYANVPQLVQIFEGKGHLVDGFWQEGGNFRDGMIEPASKPATAPKFLDPTTGLVTSRGAPPPITGPVEREGIGVPVIAGAGLVVVSGVLYALAGVTEGRVKCDPASKDSCPATEDLHGLRGRANLLVLGSGVALVGGVGLGVTGLLLEDRTPGIRVGGRF